MKNSIEGQLTKVDSAEKKKRKMSKKKAVGLSLGLIGGAVGISLGLWIKEEPRRLGLIVQSFRDGEIVQDVLDVIRSKVFPTEIILPEAINQQIELPDLVSGSINPDDIEARKLKVAEKEGSVLFLDLSRNTRPIKATSIPIGSGSFRSYTSTLLDVGAPIVMLPFTQTGGNHYILYTQFRDSGSGEIVSLSELDKSPYRGGLVLFNKDGTPHLEVLSPTDFNATDMQVDTTVMAMQEFAFTFESATLEDDLNALKNYISPSGKDLSNLLGFSSIYATFTMPDGQTKTEVIVSFQNFSEELKPINDMVFLSVSQLINLVQQRQVEIGARSFVAALPDIGRNSRLLAPKGVSPQRLYDSGNENFIQIANFNYMDSGNRTILNLRDDLLYPSLGEGGQGCSCFADPSNIPPFFFGYVDPDGVLDRDLLLAELKKESDHELVTLSQGEIMSRLENMRQSSNAILVVNLKTGETIFSHNADKEMSYASAFKTAVLYYALDSLPENIWSSVPLEYWDKDVSDAPSDFRALLAQYGDLLADLKHMIMYSDNEATGDVLAYFSSTTENPIKQFNDWAFQKGFVSTPTLLDKWGAGGTATFSGSNESVANLLKPFDFLQLYRVIAADKQKLGIISNLLRTPIADGVDLPANMYGKGGYLLDQGSEFRIFSGIETDESQQPNYFVYVAGDYSPGSRDFDQIIQLINAIK